MLYRELLIKELNDKREDFKRFADSQTDEIESYQKLLTEIGEMMGAEIVAKLKKKEDVGALPSREMDGINGCAFQFEPRWTNHEAARGWAIEILENRTTFAADASQILPGREISLPVAAIQVGTFENPHSGGNDYKKQAKFTILPPNELLDDEFDEKPMNPETKVGLRRFQAEIEAVGEFLKAKKGWQKRGERTPLAFFDGTLLVSFGQPNSNVQRQFIEMARELVILSAETRVPLVGFVDQSYAKDLINLLDEYAKGRAFLHRESNILTDAGLLQLETLKFWGDRTAFFYCNRTGLSDYFVDVDGNALVGLVYLKTTSDQVPARLDVPAWIFRENLLAEVVDIVRAECVTGLGYPYALETADAAAVISVRDREMFLRALQEFAARENLNFRVSSKRMSKARRR